MMKKKFFRIIDDFSIPNRWYLQEPVGANGKEVDARKFTAGKKVRPRSDLVVPLSRSGLPLDFTLAAFDMPIASRKVGDLLDQLAPSDIQRIPVAVDSLSSGYEIINVISMHDCVDEKQSEIVWWKRSDGRPDKIGQYRMITKLKINPEVVGVSKIFRIAGWEVALIVSHEIKLALEKEKVTGIKFSAV